MKVDPRTERGEVSSWLMFAAGLAATAALIVGTLQDTIGDLAASVGYPGVVDGDVDIGAPTDVLADLDTAMRGAAMSRGRLLGRVVKPTRTGPGVPPPGGAGDGPDNGSGGYDDKPIENLVRDTISDFNDMLDDLAEPGPTPQEELFDREFDLMYENGYTRTGKDESGATTFVHSGGQSTRTLTNLPGGGVRVEHTRYESKEKGRKAAITFLTIEPDGSRTERIQRFEYDPNSTNPVPIAATETILENGVVTSDYSNRTLPDGRQQIVTETDVGFTERIEHPDGRVFVSEFDTAGKLISEKAVVTSSGRNSSNGGTRRGSGDTSGQNGNGNNSLTRHDESDEEPYCGSCSGNTGGYGDVGNSGISGAAG